MVFKPGKENPRWNGGASKYINHSLLKKNRLIVLARDGYKCFFCGGPADRVHHKDKSNYNHSFDNLVACCAKCNSHRSNRNPTKTSKYIRLYGKTIDEIAIDICRSTGYVSKLHNMGILKGVLSGVIGIDEVENSNKLRVLNDIDKNIRERIINTANKLSVKPIDVFYDAIDLGLSEINERFLIKKYE